MRLIGPTLLAALLPACTITGAIDGDDGAGGDPAAESPDGELALGGADAGAGEAPPGDVVETIIGDMTQPATAVGRANNEAAVIFSGNYQQAVKLAPGYAPSFDNITGWCWAFESPDNAAQNAAVEARHIEVYALRGSTGAWVQIDAGRPSGYRGNRSGATGELKDEIVIDEHTIRVRPGAPPRTDLVSYEMWSPDAARRIDFVHDIVAVHARCQMRLVVHDPSQPDDLADARYAGQMGFDFWRRAAGPFEPGVTQFWGPNGRMKPITSEWQLFSVTGIKPYDPSWSNLPGELGFGPAYEVPNPYLDPPDTLTPDQLRERPPPMP